MKNIKNQHKDLMDLLDQVPGVKEHMEKFEVQMAQQILERRIELGLTQAQLVRIIQQQGERITQATISKVESGDSAVGADTYNKILHALGGAAHIEIEFGELPKSAQLALAYA
ncbi:helix-turn-helix domain-containing protein [Bacillus sp. SJS]|uniref:helix-turn-helix domain-containing protein n=1 Tax=Bacillus sp. SJS TaxID=1423321 RepID=UPI0004DD56DF|nr:helix-turn-helix domain-containing protein [Bacillus sp. SJS]KZZ82525.1 hypothetical protein AS29_020765 [Bacillus sp. SJS]